VNVTRRRGHLRLHLDPIERQFLVGLLHELLPALESADADDPVVRRLYPAGYRDDDEAQAEYRGLTEDTLRRERSDRVALCAGELAGDGPIELDNPDTARRWIQVINDLRLTLGTRLAITEDEPDFDPEDPTEQPRVVYYWLTALQDAVVTQLMR
jgi:uncharacterized protein DUF2017